METEFQTHVAFYLTGKKTGGGLDAVDGLELRPALFAAYRDLTRLRYDFPLVLVGDVSGANAVQSLSGLVDGVLEKAAPAGNDGERMRKHLLQLEREIRVLVAEGACASLSALWDAAAARLAARADESCKESLDRARAALEIDGEVWDCNEAMPVRLFRHAWSAAQEKKSSNFRKDVAGLSLKLSDILKADFVGSEEGRSARQLKASVGTTHEEVFDFDLMSRMLAKSLPKTSLPESRRQRIRWVLSVLESQRFFAEPTGGAGRRGEKPYSFVFESCSGALKAFRERLPKLIEIAKAIAIAELEINGEYNEAAHDPLFEGFGEYGLDPKDLAQFPDYLVCIKAGDAAEHARLLELLSAKLPVKVVVQFDDIVEESPIGEGHLALSLRAKQLADMAIGLGEVYVLQSSASHLVQLRDRILKGLGFHGPALFSVYSGASAAASKVPPYLAAAAAMESRAFPALSYDPSAGPDWASRFCLEDNPQAERDWPSQAFAYEDEEHQRISEDVEFTLVDFLSCDPRYAKHLARVPRAKWNGSMIPVRECLERATNGLPDKVPVLLMVDRQDVLQKVIVDEKLVQEARRCGQMWRSLQELGGIHNSHAQRLLALEKKSWEEQKKALEERMRREAEARKQEPKPAAVPAAAPAAAAAAPLTSAPAPGAPAAVPAPLTEPEPEKPSDEPCIETPRCTSCDECTQLNSRMFAYDANKQAYIANLDAGTYRELVEAAESCQVSIIHPGKPRNPNEPGLDELIKRAEPFQ